MCEGSAGVGGVVLKQKRVVDMTVIMDVPLFCNERERERTGEGGQKRRGRGRRAEEKAQGQNIFYDNGDDALSAY